MTVRSGVFRPTLLALAVGVITHALVFFTYPAGHGPDGTLYVGSSLEIFRHTIRNPYILMDRNGYYPFLIWAFRQLPGDIVTLVFVQHMVCIMLTVWTVGIVLKLLGRASAVVVALLLTLCLPLLQVPQVTNSEAACLMPLWAMALGAGEMTLRHSRGQVIPGPLWVGTGIASALAMLARPSGVLLFAPLLAVLWLLRIPKRLLVGVLAVTVVAALPMPLFNAARLGYFGTEKKGGRTLFALIWMTDHTFDPANGPKSREVAQLLRKEWPRLQQINPVVQRNAEDIEVLLNDPETLPYHLYYLVVNLARRQSSPLEADALLGGAAVEAIRKNAGPFVRTRVGSLISSFRETPRLELDATPSSRLVEKEDAAYASQTRYRYRGVTYLYHEPGYNQTPEQVESFLRDYKDCLPEGTRWNPGLQVMDIWRDLGITYAVLYVFIGLFFFLAWRSHLWDRRQETMLLAAALITYALGNRLFVYLVSAGTPLHLLPSLPFEIVLGGAGLAGALCWLRRMWAHSAGGREKRCTL